MIFLSLVIIEVTLFFAVPYQTSVQVEKDNISILANNHTTVSFSTLSGSNQILYGTYDVTSGDNISVIILDDWTYTHWIKNASVEPAFSRQYTSIGSINLSLSSGQEYHLILDNICSNVNKTVSVDLKNSFVPTTIGIPTAFLVLFLPVVVLFILVLLIVNLSKKEQAIFPKEYAYLLLFLGVVVVLILAINPQLSMSERLNFIQIAIGSVVALVSLLVSIIALKISRASKESSENLMKAQLVYNDRKSALNKLIGIMQDKQYHQLIKSYNEFRNTTDWLFIPEEVKQRAQQEINDLIRYADANDPYPEPQTDEEELAYMELQDQEYWENADPYEIYMAELSERTSRAMGNIEEEVKEYLASLSE